MSLGGVAGHATGGFTTGAATEDSVLRRSRLIAAFALPGAKRDRLWPVTQSSWPPLLRTLLHQRLTGLAIAASSDGALMLTEVQRDELSRAHQQALHAVIVLERILFRAVSEMHSAGVQPIVLKGAAFARTFYPAPSWRPYGDVDLLIPSADWAAASGALQALGFRRVLPEPRPGFTERFGKGATFRDASGAEIDLHRTLTLGPFGLWMDPDALFERTEPFAFGPVQTARLNDSMSLLHACVHAILGRRIPQLLPLRDLQQIAAVGHVDWKDLMSTAHAWRLEAPIARALTTSAEVLETPVPENAAPLARMRGSRLERRALRAYVTDRERRGGKALATLHAIPGVRRKAAYLRALLVPDRAFLSARGHNGGDGRYAARWRIPLRWMASRLRPRS